MLRWTSLRRITKVTKYSHRFASSSATSIETKSEQTEKPEVTAKERSRMVAAAFASLKDLSVTTSKRKVSPVDSRIAEAEDVDALLSISEEYISKRQALKIVSKLSDWANLKKIEVTDLENDPRYVKICRGLGHGEHEGLNDLSVVLGVTADEQAAKLISSISLPQMVKVMNSLATKGRRSTPILRSLSFNIGRSTEVLHLKQASDVFYACAALNFPDEVLLAKVTADITTSLQSNKIPGVVSSIVTSVGIMKYKDPDLLENLCNWMVENSSLCRNKEYISLVLTLGNINYVPEKFPRIYQLIKPVLKEQEMTNYQEWLDLVWSLVVLQKYDENLLTSVLHPKFISKLSYSGDIPFGTKMKLLNINGAAQQLGNSYEGPLIPKSSDIFNVSLARTKEKQLVNNCIKESLTNFLDVPLHFKFDVNTDMGFLIDFECRLNSNSQPIKESDWSEGTNHKVAIMACNYHDVCRGNSEDPHGRTALYYRLLENSDYKVIKIPFYEFNPRDKLMTRVQYLQNKLKDCIVRT